MYWKLLQKLRLSYECTIVGNKLKYNMNYGKGGKETFCLGASATSSVLQSHSPCFFVFHDWMLIGYCRNKSNKWYADGASITGRTSIIGDYEPKKVVMRWC